VPETLREWIIGLVALLGSGGIGALINGRFKPSSKAEDASAEAAADVARTDGFVKLLERVERRLEKVEAEADRCQAENAELRQANADLRQEVAELKDRLKHLEDGRLARDIADATRGLPDTLTIIDQDRVTVQRPRQRSGQ
jgi:predicted nuclease with TOPRIM domain